LEDPWFSLHIILLGVAEVGSSPGCDTRFYNSSLS